MNHPRTPRPDQPPAMAGFTPRVGDAPGHFLRPAPTHIFRGRFFRGCAVVTLATTRMKPRFLRVCKLFSFPVFGLFFPVLAFQGRALAPVSFPFFLSFIEREERKERDEGIPRVRRLRPRVFQMRSIRDWGFSVVSMQHTGIAHCEMFNVFNGLRFPGGRSTGFREKCHPPPRGVDFRRLDGCQFDV